MRRLEIMLTERKRSGVLIMRRSIDFTSSINIFELIEAKYLDYEIIDGIFERIKNFKASVKLSKVLGNHLIRLSELLIQKDTIPNEDHLLHALANANECITKYIDTVKLPEAREGALLLKKIYMITKSNCCKKSVLSDMSWRMSKRHLKSL
jgi:hypothetical protein